MATAAIIGHIVTGESIVTRVLALGPVVWIGRRSYGLYLYHFPIFVYVTSTRLGSSHVGEEGARLLLTFGLAALSYRFVETPILRKTRARRSAGSRAHHGVA